MATITQEPTNRGLEHCRGIGKTNLLREQETNEYSTVIQ